jgi:hypothetical protein
MSTIEVDMVTLPAHWVSALVNGDFSSFENDPAELAACRKSIADLAAEGWQVVSTVDNAEPFFTWHYRTYGGTAQGGDVLDYVVHRIKRDEPTEAAITDEPLDEFTAAYIQTALWSSNDDSDESGGEPLERNYGPEDIAADTLARMKADCAKFKAEQAEFFTDTHCLKYGPDFGIEGRAGHDFWLTRNRHGAGFWDGDWSNVAGDILTKAAHEFGEFDLYVGDDGLIHGMRG